MSKFHFIAETRVKPIFFLLVKMFVDATRPGSTFFCIKNSKSIYDTIPMNISLRG